MNDERLLAGDRMPDARPVGETAPVGLFHDGEDPDRFPQGPRA
jgi:hypothetical protein